MTPALLFSSAALAENASRLKRLSEETGWCWAAALTEMVPSALLRNIIEPVTQTASCGTIPDTEYLADTGFERIVVTGRMVTAESLRRLMDVAVRTKIVAVIDHFRHAELLSQWAVETGSIIEILIEVDIGEQSTGVRPGSDASLLATATSRLPRLRVAGVFADSVRRRTPAKPSDTTRDIASIVTMASIVTIAEHCLRSIRPIDPDCREIVLAAAVVRHSSIPDSRVTCLVTSPFVSFHGAACDATDEHGDERPSVCLLATVISRPTLEWCVIDAGTIVFGESHVLRVGAPLGATVLHSTADSTTLNLSGESRDLRIGDTVSLVMRDPDRLLVRRRIFVCEEQ